MRIYAAVVRNGDWRHLNYAHQLSHGARRIAASATSSKLAGFNAIATNLLQDDQYAEAYDMVQQAMRSAELGFDNLVRKAQLVGQSIYADEMRADLDFWRNCGTEWGSGTGYRDRINERNRQWFEEAHSGEADARVLALVKESWDEAILEIRQLLVQA